jgi:hypothetical protein
MVVGPSSTRLRRSGKRLAPNPPQGSLLNSLIWMKSASAGLKEKLFRALTCCATFYLKYVFSPTSEQNPNIALYAEVLGT